MNYKIYIQDQLIDTQGAKFTLNFSLAELEDFTKRKAFKTSTIKVPATGTNQKVFDYLEEVGVRFPSQQLAGYISAGALTFRGYVKLYDSTIVDGLAYYQFQIICSDWLDILKGVRLSDLDWSDLNHTITATNINTADSGSLDYIYPLIDFGKFKDDDRVKSIERFPSVRISTIYDKILQYCGYTHNSSSFFQQAANQKYFLFDMEKIYINDPDFAENKLFMASCDDSYSQTIANGASGYILRFGGSPLALGETTVLVGYDDTDPDNFPDLFEDTENYSTSVYKYTADVAGSYRFRQSLVYTYTNTGLTNVSFKVGSVIKKNATAIVASVYGDLHTTDSTPKGGTVIADTSFIHLDVGETIEAFAELKDGEADNESGTSKTFLINLTNSSRFWNDADPRRGNGYQLEFSSVLPDIEVIKFLQSVNGLFNLWFYQNVHERDLLILQSNNFHSTTYTDWSGKLDLSKPVTVSKYEAPKKITYSYAEDSKDFIISNNAGYLSSDYDFDNNQKDTEEVRNNYFTRTWFNYCRRIGLETEYKIPVLWKEYDKAETNIPGWTHDFKPRILYFDSNQTTTPDSWIFEFSTKSTVPHFTETNLQPSDIKDNYGFTHKNMEESKIIEAYFRLTENDIADFMNVIPGADFRTPIYIDSPLFAGTYYVMEIKGFDVDGGSCKVQLLQVNDKTIK